jgi:2-desacetyl-2-hydroxyethyl bacteriochlorophyllide A dehydrogenase
MNAQKIVIDKPGSYDALSLTDFDCPPPSADEVAIKVHAAGVNYADCVIRMGLYKSANELHGFPITPGFEVAGEIIAVGKNVDNFCIGDRVLGVTLFGGYCSQINLIASQVFPIPENLNYAEAAGTPTVYLTAWFALHYLANIKADEKVLVHSGAGGVGLAALQLAKQAGAHPVAVVGAEHKIQTAKQYGAYAVIDKSNEDLWKSAESIATEGFQAILDPNGYSTLQASYEHLAPLGRLVIYGFHSMLPKSSTYSKGRPNYLKLARDWLRTPRFNPLEMTADNKSVMAFNLSFVSSRVELMQTAMTEILNGLKHGQLKPLPVQTYPLKEAAVAQQNLETARTIGKLILTN